MFKVRLSLIRFTILSLLIASPLFGNLSLISAAEDAPAKITIRKYPGPYTSFFIESDQGVKIITDPYNMDQEINVDIVTESHDHSDHSDVSKILAPYKLITTCGEFSEKGVKITGIPGVHNRFDKVVTNIIYVFDIGGFRIAQFASQGAKPNQENLNKIGKVDVLIIQCYFNPVDKISLESAAAIAQELKAKIVIPAHGAGSAEHLTKFAQILSNQDFVPVPGGKITLSRADLDKMTDPQVMVLER